MSRIILIQDDNPLIAQLWEENMHESWENYAKATKFIQTDDDSRIIGGFAVYWDKSDGVEGHFVSGWSARKNLPSVIAVIQHLANRLGEIYIKTDKRQVKIIAARLGERVKKSGSFWYYKVKGE